MALQWKLDPNVTEVVDDATAEILCKMTPAERLELCFEAHKWARAMIGADVRAAHPDWLAVDIRDEMNRIMWSQDEVKPYEASCNAKIKERLHQRT